jgi:predicted transcriptional regulator
MRQINPKKIQEYMARHGITQTALAEKLDVTPSAVSYYFSTDNVGYQTLNKIIRAVRELSKKDA